MIFSRGDAQAGDESSRDGRRTNDRIGQQERGDFLLFDLGQHRAALERRIVILEFDARQAIDLEQRLVAKARLGLDNRQPAPDRAEMANAIGRRPDAVYMPHHRLAELDSALEKVGIVAAGHAQNVRAAIGIAFGQRRIAGGDELHAITGLDQPAHKVRDVRAGPFGAGHNVKGGIEHGGLGVHRGLL